MTGPAVTGGFTGAAEGGSGTTGAIEAFDGAKVTGGMKGERDSVGTDGDIVIGAAGARDPAGVGAPAIGAGDAAGTVVLTPDDGDVTDELVELGTLLPAGEGVVAAATAKRRIETTTMNFMMDLKKKVKWSQDKIKTTMGIHMQITTFSDHGILVSLNSSLVLIPINHCHSSTK